SSRSPPRSPSWWSETSRGSRPRLRSASSPGAAASSCSTTGSAASSRSATRSAATRCCSSCSCRAVRRRHRRHALSPLELALRARGARVVGADADWLAAGLGLADEGGVLPRCEEPDFVDQLCALAERTGATVLISTIAEELVVLARAPAALADAGLHAWLPD